MKIIFLKDPYEEFLKSYGTLCIPKDEESYDRNSFNYEDEEFLNLNNFPQVIIPNCLYLGDYFSAKDQDILSYFNIKNIINISLIYPNHFPSTINYLKIDIDDNQDTNISKYFDTALLFIENSINNKQAVLVHW